ncbi:hopanoid-associated sugar epimerase [Granulibacter bethesdensis]|uniref:hopanoid-associated sugar epimerase n=1 Tax=Granulibacter bethesdensis TaxID=364410 RepID=UPI000909D391|nr:hopanoid-associated sugar epimerase [Granulibacter bethesdensis]APH60317.1 Nucleoside-diphosphate-sugar epimerase [Granulibacter bethesdensis]
MTSPGRAFVTGATGFVGSAVARALLQRGWKVRLLTRRSSDTRNLAGLTADIVEGDLLQPESITPHLHGCQALFHVAADYRIWVPEPEAMMRANVDGTVALLRAAQAAGIERIVYCSSVAALGLIGDGTPSTEDTPNSEAKTVGIYKKSKYRAEQAVLRLVAEEGVPAVIVNPSTPIGPRDVKPTPTGRMIRDAALGKMPAYLDTGLNVVHVDDVAEGHLLAMEHGVPGERYILGGTDMHLADILAMVARETGRKPPRIRLNETALWPLAMASETLARLTGIEPLVTRDHLRMARKKMFFSSAKARTAFGWSPRPAEEAIRDAVAWFRQNDPAFIRQRTVKGTTA